MAQIFGRLCELLILIVSLPFVIVTVLILSIIIITEQTTGKSIKELLTLK